MSEFETTTRYIDLTNTSLNNVDEILCSEHPDEVKADGISYVNFKVTKPKCSEKIRIANHDVEYKFYRYSYDQVPQGADLDDSLNPHQSGWIIAYVDNKKIHYIINRYSLAQFVLRKFLKYTQRNAIRQEMNRTYGDLFVWMISRVYNLENQIENGDDSAPDDVIIDDISGFKGKTENNLNTISAKGSSIVNILSTLSFLIESQNLKQITFHLNYDNIPPLNVILSTSSTVALNIVQYLAYKTDCENKDDEVARLFLRFYIEILPVIIQNYDGELETNKWGKDGCVKFLQTVAKALSDKVDLRINDLKTNPDQLRFSNDANNEPEQLELDIDQDDD